MNEERIGCEFCYYEYFDGKAYPCSMCIRGEERTDKFEPKGRHTKQTERMKTHDYCDICNHKGCGTCIANNLDDYCVPSNYEPTTQKETQNSNLTFEKVDTPQTERSE